MGTRFTLLLKIMEKEKTARIADERGSVSRVVVAFLNDQAGTKRKNNKLVSPPPPVKKLRKFIIDKNLIIKINHVSTPKVLKKKKKNQN